jgi:hypothetical protein
VSTASQWLKASGVKIPSLTASELKQATVYQLLQLENSTDIISFRLAADTDNAITEYTNKGSLFNVTGKSILNKVKAGDLITFEDIMIKENGFIKKIPPVIYQVVN